MLTLDIFGPGVTEASAEQARKSIDQVLASRGARLWHAARASHELHWWGERWFGHADVPELPKVILDLDRTWSLCEDVLAELCGTEAEAVVVGEFEPADELLPWPPLTDPVEEEFTADEIAEQVRQLVAKGWAKDV